MNNTLPPDQRSAALIDELLWLSRDAQQRLDLGTADDYWYVLGERNTYARAAALVAAPNLGDDCSVIAERVVSALRTSAFTSGESDLNQLRSAVFGSTDPAATRASSTLNWLGPKAFDATFGNVPGVDRDFGMRWGPAHNQRLSLRRDPDASDTPDAAGNPAGQVGMLYAYDPTWDEYALLQPRIPEAIVGEVFLEALTRDEHLPVEDFARLVQAHHDLRGRAIPSGRTVNTTARTTARITATASARPVPHPTAGPTVSPSTWVLEP